MTSKPALLLTLGLLASTAAPAATLYHCVDAQGRSSFKDQPCAGSEQTKNKTVISEPAKPAPALKAAAPVEPELVAATPQEAEGLGAALLAPVRAFQGRAYVAEGLALATQIKVAVAEFYSETGRLPQSNKELGLPPANEYQRNAVKALAVGKGGVISVQFNEKSGLDGGVVRLVPDVSKPHMGMGWSCVSPSYKSIESWAPQCRFEG